MVHVLCLTIFPWIFTLLSLRLDTIDIPVLFMQIWLPSLTSIVIILDIFLMTDTRQSFIWRMWCKKFQRNLFAYVSINWTRITELRWFVNSKKSHVLPLPEEIDYAFPIYQFKSEWLFENMSWKSYELIYCSDILVHLFPGIPLDKTV